MALEDLVSSISDFVGDISENIDDAIVDIGDFCKETVENISDQGMEALENGDLKEAVECSDISEEYKEGAKLLLEGVNKPPLISGAKLIAGVVGTVAALATPGLQIQGVAALTMAVKGAEELSAHFNSNKNVNALINA